jgi:hypothetical protein
MQDNVGNPGHPGALPLAAALRQRWKPITAIARNTQ